MSFFRWFQTDAPDNDRMPQDDNGENFIVSLNTDPPTILGIVSAATIDALSGIDGENVEEVISEYERKFVNAGKTK